MQTTKKIKSTAFLPKHLNMKVNKIEIPTNKETTFCLSSSSKVVRTVKYLIQLNICYKIYFTSISDMLCLMLAKEENL